MFPPPPPSEMQYERIKNIRDSISCDISKYAAHLRPFGSCDTAGQCLCRSNGRAGRGVPLHCSPMGLLQGEAGSIMHVFASIIAAYRALYISGNMYLFSCTEMCVHLYTVALPCMKRVHTASCEPHLRSEHWCASQGCHRLSKRLHRSLGDHGDPLSDRQAVCGSIRKGRRTRCHHALQLQWPQVRAQVRQVRQL